MAKVKTLRDLQLAELRILKNFKKYCDDNNLKYYMLGGTFLGAVRHKGFIPWDDDIDMGMPREDYDKFIKEYSGTYTKDTFENETEFTHYALRLIDSSAQVVTKNGEKESVWSAWVDIFPLDGMPNNALLRKIHIWRLSIARAKFKLSTIEQVPKKKKRSLIEKTIIRIAAIFNPWKHKKPIVYIKQIDKLLRKYPTEKSNYYINYMGAYKTKEMFKKEVYADIANYKFEDIELPAPKDYDKVLSQLYGNYMQVPPEYERNKHNTQLERE